MLFGDFVGVYWFCAWRVVQQIAEEVLASKVGEVYKKEPTEHESGD